MSFRCATIVMLLIWAGIVHADPVDDFVSSEMNRQQIPGLSLAVVQNGKILKEKGYGLSDIENEVPVTPDTVFQSGSLGKQFTSALVMLLVKDGKLSLDASISSYLPNTPKSWEAITVRHLLTHTAGLADPYQRLDMRRDYTDDELLKIFAEIPVLLRPGEMFAYSNMGYQVLGFLCTKVAGRFYGDQLRERIFQPIGMGTRNISGRDIVMHRAAGYSWFEGEIKNQEWVSPSLNSTADGGLYLTAHDLALWDLALYGESPLDAAIKEASWSPVKLNDNSTYPYGFGWDLQPVNGHRSIAHSGTWQGFKTFISRFVDDKLTVIVLTNFSGAKPGMIAHGVAGLYIPALKP